MSKIIYDVVINDVENLHKSLGDKQSRDISAKNIIQALEKAYLQEKLLGLYRYLSENTSESYLHYDEVDEIHNQVYDIEKLIKELET